jgi:hypothetical protein
MTETYWPPELQKGVGVKASEERWYQFWTHQWSKSIVNKG